MTESTWLWPGWIPRGHLSMLTAPADSEKALVAAWIGATALRGGSLPDGQRIEPESGRTVVWLLDAASKYGPMLNHLRLLRAPDSGIRWPVDPSDEQNDFPAVDLTVRRWQEFMIAYAPQRRPSWVVVDGLGPLCGETRRGVDRALEVMAGIAQEVGCAITFLHDQDNRSRGPGAQGWALVAKRMGTIIRLKQWAPATRDMELRVIRTTFHDRPDPLRLRFDEEIPEVVRRPHEPPKYAIDRAVEYLEQELSRGPKPAFEITDRGWWQHKISPRTLQRAKGRLDVKSYKSGGRWWWILG